MKITHSNFSNPSPIKLKINLENMPFSVYRRVLVPEDVNMMQLHFIIQIAMGWQFAHLFQFSDKMHDPNIRITVPYEGYDDLSTYRVKTEKVDKILLKNEFEVERGRKPFWYWYDFGDDWWHKITFQKPTKKDLELFDGTPICVDATGACPPEDIGGPWGYENFLAVITNKKHPEYKEYREWAGITGRKRYDPDFVDMEMVNADLKEYYRSPAWKIKADEYFGE